MKFRKKPVVIEAFILERRFGWPDWFHDAVNFMKKKTFIERVTRWKL